MNILHTYLIANTYAHVLICLGIPLKKMERINFILECIETEKVILSKALMYKVSALHCIVVFITQLY